MFGERFDELKAVLGECLADAIDDLAVVDGVVDVVAFAGFAEVVANFDVEENGLRHHAFPFRYAEFGLYADLF